MESMPCNRCLAGQCWTIIKSGGFRLSLSIGTICITLTFGVSTSCIAVAKYQIMRYEVTALNKEH